MDEVVETKCCDPELSPDPSKLSKVRLETLPGKSTL